MGCRLCQRRKDEVVGELDRTRRFILEAILRVQAGRTVGTGVPSTIVSLVTTPLGEQRADAVSQLTIYDFLEN